MSGLVSPRMTRVVLVCLLLGGHGVLFTLHAQQPTNPEAWVFPGPDAFFDSPDEYVSRHVATTGVTEQRNPVVITVGLADRTARMTIVGGGIAPEPGDTVRVYGVLEGPRTIRALDAVAVQPGGYHYAWTVSFVAGLVVLWRFLRHWTVDPATLSVRPRETRLRIRSVLAALVSGGED